MTVTGGPERSDLELLTEMTVRLVWAEEALAAAQASIVSLIAKNEKLRELADAAEAQVERYRDIITALEAELAQREWGGSPSAN